MSVSSSDEDFATLKSLFPYIPDTTIKEHLQVFTSDGRLELISNLLIDYQDDSNNAAVYSGTREPDSYDTSGMFELDNYDFSAFTTTQTTLYSTSCSTSVSSGSQQGKHTQVSPTKNSLSAVPSTGNSSCSVGISKLPPDKEAIIVSETSTLVGEIRTSASSVCSPAISVSSSAESVCSPAKSVCSPAKRCKYEMPVSTQCSSILRPVSPTRQGLRIEGYGFDYKRPRKAIKKTSPVKPDIIDDDDNDELPQVLRPSDAMINSECKPPWKSRLYCVEQMHLRFPNSTNYPELIEAKELCDAIQELDNQLFSPTYNKNTCDEDLWTYKWYWRCKHSSPSQPGKCFEKWSQEKLEQTYSIHKENAEKVRIMLRRDKKLESFHVHFWSMSLSKQNNEWYLTRLKIRKISTQSSASDDVACVYPSTWQDQRLNSQLFNLKEGSPEWNNVCGQFNKSLPRRVQILTIQRVQNKFLWKKYYLRKKLFAEKNGMKNVNEKQLFHGTAGNEPSLIWKGETGFDLRFCQSGMWGKGTYFAENSSYSLLTYAHRSANGTRQLFLANVLTGFNTELPPDNMLTMPPERIRDENGGIVRYDSVSGVTHDCKVYIVYQLEYAYPSYLITYRV